MSDVTFETYRPLLFSIAYRMLGSAMDAEDMVQETWLRYRRADPQEVESPKAYLSTIVTRLSINRLNSARMQREKYIGPWLPEPVLTGGTRPARELGRYDAISTALLIVLERLTPAERAVYLLREMFDYSYEEIAAIVEKSQVACRKLYSRARRHVKAHQPRFEHSPEAHRRLVRRFLQAAQTGDMEGLTALLARDAIAWTDGGGQVVAALQAVRGREQVARFITRARRFAPPAATGAIAHVNGKPAIVLRTEAGRAFLVINFETDEEYIHTLHIVGNPQKLVNL